MHSIALHSGMPRAGWLYRAYSNMPVPTMPVPTMPTVPTMPCAEITAKHMSKTNCHLLPQPLQKPGHPGAQRRGTSANPRCRQQKRTRIPDTVIKKLPRARCKMLKHYGSQINGHLLPQPLQKPGHPGAQRRGTSANPRCRQQKHARSPDTAIAKLSRAQCKARPIRSCGPPQPRGSPSGGGKPLCIYWN